MKPKARPKKKRINPEIVEEADRIHELATSVYSLARPLTWRFASKITDPISRGNARMDFDMIVRHLAPGDPETVDPVRQWPTKAIWQRFRRQFVDQKAQATFFAAIDAFAQRYTADIIFAHAMASLDDTPVQPPDLLWDEELLPRGAAPYLLRQWTRDQKLAREFLLALFDHFERDVQLGSPGRRAILIAQNATVVGFKPAAQTERLIATGDENLGQKDNEADRKLAFDQKAATVGRAIRRLRHKAKTSPPVRRRP